LDCARLLVTHYFKTRHFINHRSCRTIQCPHNSASPHPAHRPSHRLFHEDSKLGRQATTLTHPFPRPRLNCVNASGASTAVARLGGRRRQQTLQRFGLLAVDGPFVASSSPASPNIPSHPASKTSAFPHRLSPVGSPADCSVLQSPDFVALSFAVKLTDHRTGHLSEYTTRPSLLRDSGP